MRNKHSGYVTVIILIILILLSTMSITFIPLSSAQWKGVWGYSKVITIESDYIDDDLTNFPLLISTTDLDLVSHAQTDGGDIVFVDNSDNQLNHEIENYNSTTGELIAWVNVTSIDSSTDTIIHMYYGNPTCANQENVLGTWQSSFGGVWHMNQVLANDSTQQNSDATVVAGVPTVSPGKIYNSVDFGTPGPSGMPREEAIDLGADTNISLINADKFTVSFWVLYDGNTGVSDDTQVTFAQSSAGCSWQAIMGTYPNEYNDYNMKFVHRDDNSVGANGTSGRHNLGQQATQIIEAGIWEYWVFTYDNIADEKIMYRNGSFHLKDTVSIDNLRGLTIATTSVGDGCDFGDTGGQVDELRISVGSVYNASWIKASFHSESKTTGFLTIGSEIILHPIACFSYTITGANIEVVSCSENTNNITLYKWESSDDEVNYASTEWLSNSTGTSYIFTYPDGGNINIRLTVKNGTDGMLDSKSVNIIDMPSSRDVYDYDYYNMRSPCESAGYYWYDNKCNEDPEPTMWDETNTVDSYKEAGYHERGIEILGYSISPSIIIFIAIVLIFSVLIFSVRKKRGEKK